MSTSLHVSSKSFIRIKRFQSKTILIFSNTANTITVLFFTHCITKFIYVAANSEKIHRTMSIWNQSNTNPLFAESDSR